MELKKLSPDAYRLHDYLKVNALGKANAIKAIDLCLRAGISDTRTLRKLRAEVNSGISELNKKILTGNSGYYIASSETPEEAYKQYKESAWRKIKTGVAMIEEGERLLKMIGEDTQTRLDITGNLKDIEIYVKPKTESIKTIGSIMDDLERIASDPLCIEAMKLYGGVPDNDEEEDEEEYTEEDYKADEADNINDEIKLGIRDKDGNLNE
jgi:hypothetical protein